MDVTADIKGLPEIDYILGIAGPRIADRFMQAAVKDAATIGVKDMRQRVPVKSGTLKRSIVAKSERAKPGLFVATIRITKGRAAKNDGWYWHFVEFGTSKSSPKPFITPAYDSLKQMITDGAFPRILGERVIKGMAALRKKVAKG